MKFLLLFLISFLIIAQERVVIVKATKKKIRTIKFQNKDLDMIKWTVKCPKCKIEHSKEIPSDVKRGIFECDCETVETIDHETKKKIKVPKTFTAE